MQNFDDLFVDQPAQQEERPFDKDAWAAKKQAEREGVYLMIDTYGHEMSIDGGLFRSYLNVQARFDRYSVSNAILIAAQYPEATRLADFDTWKGFGTYVRRGQDAISILEPGKEYQKDDGSAGVSCNVKKVFDISQTHSQQRPMAAVACDDRLLLKALMNNAPCRFAISNELPENIVQGQADAQYEAHSSEQNGTAGAATITWKSVQSVLGVLWLGGAIAAGLILLLANLRFAADLRHRRSLLEIEDCSLPVYEVEELPSPCLIGLIQPAVYVTSATAENPVMLRHVLAHEETHARHLDHVWSFLRCAALAIHWWNPLVWLAVALSRRDSEFACDEGTLQRLGGRERKAYGWTLLTLSTAAPAPTQLFNCATTMAGSKKTLWERVSRIAKGSKQLMWAVVLAVVIAVSATACSFAQASAPGEVFPDPGNSVPVESEQPASDSAVPMESETAETKYDDAEALAAYRAVLAGKTEFTHVANPDETLNLNIANICDVYNPGQIVVSIDFTVLDLDGDGIREVVLGLDRNNGGVGGFEILHYQDGVVYGFLRYIRGFNDLKADGTFWFSSSAADHGFGKINFTKNGYTVDEITYSESGESFADMTYVVDHQPSTEDAFNAAVNVFDGKESATWYNLTEENMEGLLG